MPEKIYACVFGIQKKQIEHYCFEKCGKVIVGIMDDEELGSISYCYEENCPYNHSTMNEPFGVVGDDEIYLRRLIDVKEEMTNGN